MKTRQIRGGALSAVGLVCALAVSASVMRAQSALPTGWASRDVGSTGVVGSASVSSGTWTVAGSGANIWGTSDEFRFAYQQITGDVDIRVRLASIEDAQEWSKAGVMIRETLNANARNAFMMLMPKSGLFLQSRATSGGSTGRLTGRAGAAPVWLRLVRQGNQFTGYFSTNGTSWASAGTVTNNMAATAYVGLAVNSRKDGILTTATFTNLQVSAGAGLTTTTLPAPWINRDIGSPVLAGSASAASGTFTVTAGGTNIWGTSDQFHFVYQPMQGDVEVVARVASLQYADPWSKAGVMIRESLTGGSRNAFMMVSGTEGSRFQRRIETGDISYEDAGPSGSAPKWVRLVREGNLFTAYHSTDGTTWSLVGSDAISMASTVYVGIAVTSYDAAQRATATFTNLTAGTLTAGTNRPPTVSITSPANGATYTAPASMTVSATAGDTDGTITKVDFYLGTTWIGSDTTSSYSKGMTIDAAGTYQLKAVATDNDGATSTSSISVTVTASTVTATPTRIAFTASADHATNVTSYSVAIYRGADSVTAASPVATRDLGKPTPVNGDITVDISTLVNPLPAGTYKAVVRAIGSGGTTASAPSPTFTK